MSCQAMMMAPTTVPKIIPSTSPSTPMPTIPAATCAAATPTDRLMVDIERRL